MLDMMGGAGATLEPLPGRLVRHHLAAGAWVDVLPGFVQSSDAVFDTLLHDVDWKAERRPMYDGVVDVPRLLRWYGRGERLPHPLLTEARDSLTAHYAPELGEPFVTAGMCLYRDGRDSVAWHGDTLGRSSREDTMVAIVSFGSPRNLVLRPRPGVAPTSSTAADRLRAASDIDRLRAAASHDVARPTAETLRFPLGHGDLIVMGGSCQRTWEHAIPKTAKPVGPRVSVQFRPINVA
ncbi:alpha-ketoglutarate-dependent dioxygenase AlkB [Symbioplanes lichenis]|uniref:alpha-ketoglutarate-dependent dioxygenase AlkB n=1 Tax=Symbioplanes lichenis TaxID=1629072 RepID=UPI00273A12BE|nr:alpha-ketoglutarate-dependent dioxygenase AlkB [Actinoplanes lichenis]